MTPVAGVPIRGGRSTPSVQIIAARADHFAVKRTAGSPSSGGSSAASGTTPAGRVIGAVVAAAILLVTAGSSAAAQDTVAATPLEELARCVQQRNHLSVLMLIDESGSLETTDPAAERVVAARAALGTLAALGETELAGERPTVELRLAAFASEFTPLTDWIALDAVSRDELDDRLGDFADRTDGLDTDLATALLGAADALTAQAARLAEAGVESCQALMVFTDGRLDVEPRATPETKPYAPDLPLDVAGNDVLVEQRAFTALCQPGGTVDRLRTGGVTVLTLALTSAVAPEDEYFLQALTTGTAGLIGCGSVPGGSSGQFLPVADLTGLLTTFDSVAATISGGTVDEAPRRIEVCPGSACEPGRHPIAIDPAVRRLTILVTSDAPQLAIEILDPSDPDPVLITRDGGDRYATGTAEIDASWLSANAVTLDLRPTDEAAAADGWRLTAIDPTGAATGAGATVQLTRYGDLFPRLAQDPQLTPDRQITLVADVLDGDSVQVVALPALTSLSARIADVVSGAAVDAQLTPGPGGHLQAEVPLPDGWGTEVEVTLTLEVTTDAGLVLPPQTSTSRHTLIGPTGDGSTDPGTPAGVPDDLAFADRDGGRGWSTPSPTALLGVAALALLAGLWIRRILTSRFKMAGIQWTTLPVVIRQDGDVQRIDWQPGPVVFDPADFRALPIRTETRRFDLDGMAFSARLPLHPFDRPTGVVRCRGPAAGSLGRADRRRGVLALVALDLSGQWVFELDEETTLDTNRSPTLPTFGEVYGRLSLFVAGDHFQAPSPELRQSLTDELPRLARGLRAGLRARRGLDVADDDDDRNTLALLDRMFPSDDAG